MSAFIICWLPFFVLALVRPFVGVSAIPLTINSLFLWLGYANSLLNPIIYATLNKDFRKPFKVIEIYFIYCRMVAIEINGRINVAVKVSWITYVLYNCALSN